MNPYSANNIEARFYQAAVAMQWKTGTPYRPGVVSLTRTLLGWRIVQINERGGEEQITRPLSACELSAFIDGILYARSRP
jgi:hypothetical protein